MGAINTSTVDAWLSINAKTATMAIKWGKTEPEKIQGFQSRLHRVDFTKKPANEEFDIPEHNVFQFFFEDSDDGTLRKYALELREGTSITNNFLNSLLGVPVLGPGIQVYFRVYEKKGNTNLYIAESSLQGADKLPWKFEWNKNENWFDGVPHPIETDELGDNGLPKKDYTPVTLFWRSQFLTSIYSAINGKPWAAPRETDKVRSISTNMIAKANEQTIEKMEELWPRQVDWLKTKLDSEEDRNEVLETLFAVYQKKGGKKQLLPKKEEKKAEAPAPGEVPENFDDLPF